MTIRDLIQKKFHNQTPQQLKQEILWMLTKMRQYRWKILTVGLLGIVGTGMGLASNVATKYLIDAVTGYHADMLKHAAVIMFLTMLGSLLLQGISSRVSASVHLKVKNEMQHLTYGRILRAGWESLESFRSGDLLNRLTSDSP